MQNNDTSIKEMLDTIKSLQEQIEKLQLIISNISQEPEECECPQVSDQY